MFYMFYRLKFPYQMRETIYLVFFVIDTWNICSIMFLSPSRDKISTGFQRRYYKIKSKLSRLRHSRNAVPFARIESAVASMGVNIRDACARKGGSNGIFRLVTLKKGTDDAEISGRFAAFR